MNLINYSCIPFEMYYMNLYMFYHYYFAHCYLMYAKFGPLVLRIFNLILHLGVFTIEEL